MKVGILRGVLNQSTMMPMVSIIWVVMNLLEV